MTRAGLRAGLPFVGVQGVDTGLPRLCIAAQCCLGFRGRPQQVSYLKKVKAGESYPATAIQTTTQRRRELGFPYWWLGSADGHDAISVQLAFFVGKRDVFSWAEDVCVKAKPNLVVVFATIIVVDHPSSSAGSSRAVD